MTSKDECIQSDKLSSQPDQIGCELEGCVKGTEYEVLSKDGFDQCENCINSDDWEKEKGY